MRGKGLWFASTDYVQQDHPRLCGEKAFICTIVVHMQGSPPPMRGKVCTCGITYKVHRITPAYAGKSNAEMTCNFGNQDHPRLCGEKKLHSVLQRRLKGSPPPMRGKARLSSGCRARARITPAYAGKRPLVLSVIIIHQDHPRLCGEKVQRTAVE